MSVQPADITADDYLRAWDTREWDSAYHALIELGVAARPALVRRFQATADSKLKSALVEIIWQHRDPGALPFLATALQEPDPTVWKQALDGLVAIGTPDALAILEHAREEHLNDRAEFGSWLEEAIGQVRQSANK